MKHAAHIPVALMGLALCLSATCALPAQVATTATQGLLSKAHTLEARGRLDMAAQTWQQVLLADPNNTEALGGLARAARLSGNDALARTYVQRLRNINPNDPGIARAEAAASAPGQLAQLQRAGALAQQGSYAQAMALYRQVYGSQPPPGDWGLAYYETEAATEEGRAHAIAGLRSFAAKYPRESRYQIALGRTLTYSPRTRAEGRRVLEQYPNDPDAAAALKQSLVWDAQNPAALGDIRAYMKTHQDAGLQQALREGEARAQRDSRARAANLARNADPAEDGGTFVGTEAQRRALGAELNAAFAALNAKRFDDADTRFQAVLAKDPHSARALAGLGYVRMNQQKFGAAISLLEQARQNGATDPGLDRNLEVSRFYALVSEGGAALDASDLTAAEQKFRQALQMRPSSAEALQGLGGTLLKAGMPQAAVPYFEQCVKARPSVAAWQGLITAEFQAGNAPLALDTERRIPAGLRAQLMRDPDYLRTLAAAYTAVGRDVDAQRILRSALDLPFPAEARGVKAETRLQYAALLLQANRLDQASGLYRQVLADDSNNVPAWQGLVNTQHSMHNDALALQTLESMPPAAYDQALRDTGFVSSAAAVYQANNKPDLAEALLEGAVAQRNTTGQVVPLPLQIQLAGLYLQRNSPARAYPIYQRVLRENPDRIDAWTGLLTSLHATGRDGEALAQIQQIPAPVRTQLEGNVDYLQTVGQIYNGLGQPRQAMLFLNRVRQHYAAQHTLPPADVDIQNAWLLFNGMNDAGLYRQLMVLGSRSDLSDDQRRTVQTIWASWAVRRANQASAANNPKRALAILNAAARTFPDNPAVLRALASGYQQAGQPKEAVAIFRSQDMTSTPASDYKAAVGAALAAGDLKSAETWLRFGLDQYPRDGGMLSLAAKFEQARGDSGRAAEYYKASLAMLPPADPGAELAAALRTPLPLNPRALPNGQQPQDLASLLAPGGDGATLPQRPYLPAYDNAYGTAPVQFNGNAGLASQDNAGGAALVPPYMSNGAERNGGWREGAVGGTRGVVSPARLGDYRPAPETYADPYTDANPQGSSFPPATGNPVVPSGSGSMGSPADRYPGMSELRVPAATVAPADTDAIVLEQRTAMQEQVRRATMLAQSGSPVFAESGATSAATYRAEDASADLHQSEGAQAGAFGKGEVYGPFVPYVAPTQQGAPAVSYSASNVDMPSTTIITQFPTGPGKLVPLHNARNMRRVLPHHAQDDEAEAAETRRRQSEPEIVAGNDPEPDDLSDDGRNVQYGGKPTQGYRGTIRPAPGQVQRPSSLPATAPTSGSPANGGSAASGQEGTAINGTVTTVFPQGSNPVRAGGISQEYGQQYPQPQHAPSRTVARRKVTPRRRAGNIASFGPGAPPVFYPGVPTPLSTQPYPDLPPYNNGEAPSDAQLMARNVPPLRGRYEPDATSTTGPPLTERQQTELDLAQLEASYSGWVGGTAWLRTRSGDPGITRLFDYEVPFEASAVVNRTVRLTVVPTAVFLNSGTVNTSQYTGATGAIPYLGTVSAATTNTPSPQYSSGIGGELQIVTQNFGVALGYTPYEFLVGNVTGRFRYRPSGGPITLYGERDTVRDTQLSYAGLRDPGSITVSNPGNIWGGVVATGGGIRFDTGNERAGLYLSADGATLTGQHVLDNTRIEGTGGAYFRVRSFPGVGTLNVGASMFGMHFAHNERGTSYGLGGYFSPDVYFLGSIPVTFTGHYKTDWHYVVQGAVGIQTFQEANDPYFPLDPATQTAAQANCTAISLQQRNCTAAYQPLNTSTGANFNISAEGSYRIADHWYAGMALSANNTNNYNVVRPTVYLRYLFKPQYPTDDYPSGLFPTEGLRPLRVP